MPLSLDDQTGILPDHLITALAREGGILPAYDFAPDQIQPASIDLRLGSPALAAPATVMANVLGGDYADIYHRYLHVMAADPGVKMHMYGKAVRPGRKIGLSWRGGVGYTGKTRRSIPLEQLLPVLRLAGIHFVNLQYTDVREEIRALKERHALVVHHWQEAIDDYDQTAALVSALDGVLTVCTAIVHLTGGLGKPGLVMVPHGADWRYGGEGERMAWYPTVRLFRQKALGEWGPVFARMAGS